MTGADDGTPLIHHDHPNEQYTILANGLLRDKSLSAEAVGVAARLLSHVGGWRFNAKMLAAEWPGMSERAAAKAIGQLESAGYVHRIIKRQQGRVSTELHMFGKPTDQCALPGCRRCPPPTLQNWGVGATCENGSTDPTLSGGHIEDHKEPKTLTSSQTRQKPAVSDPARATRIPDDFRPAEVSVRQVERVRPDVNWRAETQRFIAYWQAKPGKAGEKTSWQRTWVNWMSRARGTGRPVADDEPVPNYAPPGGWR